MCAPYVQNMCGKCAMSKFVEMFCWKIKKPPPKIEAGGDKMEKGFIVIKPGMSDEEFEKIMQFLELVQKAATENSEDKQK